MAEALKILVVDDQVGVKGSPAHLAFMDNYGELGYAFVFATAEEARGQYSPQAALGTIEYHSDAALILLDIKFGRESDRLGVDILSEAASRHPMIPFIMMTSLEDEPATVVKCLRIGAREYVTKGEPPDKLKATIERHARRITESHLILGESEAVCTLRSEIERIATSPPRPVLILGEQGTGKELVAKSIHYLGSRRNEPFVAVNCGAFGEDIFKAELFGAEQGAYTSANRRKYGFIEIANGGVLFLDEIAEASLEVQVSLLRVLEERSIYRVGGTEKIDVDFQLICATNADLTQLIKEKRFRPEFYGRIRVLEISTPPLRDRAEDIELLANHFLRGFREEVGGTSLKVQGFEPAAMRRLKSYSWPGNIRELKNIVERAMIFARTDMIQPDDLPTEVSGQRASTSTEQPLEPGVTNLNYRVAKFELDNLWTAYRSVGENKARTMKSFYPEFAANYFDRIIFDAVKRAPDVLQEFPQFRDAYESECQRRGRSQ